MSNYIRDKTQGGCYFLTFNLLDRESSLLLTHINKFRDAYAKTIQHHQFKLDAMVVLPDHVHIMITLSPILKTGNIPHCINWLKKACIPLIGERMRMIKVSTFDMMC